MNDAQNRPHLAYYIDDDGVWLDCGACEFAKNLGFDFPARDVAIALQEHDKDCEVR